MEQSECDERVKAGVADQTGEEWQETVPTETHADRPQKQHMDETGDNAEKQKVRTGAMTAHEAFFFYNCK